MIMQAVVIEVQWDRLLVLDLDTRQNVLVVTREARRFRPGDFVRIRYSGVMTRSIPPQIYAQHITVLQQPPFLPPVLPPVLLPPIVFPPIGRPPIGRPPHNRPPHNRPPHGRPPHGRPDRPR